MTSDTIIPAIEMPVSIRQHLEATICRFPPEHYAVLLGAIDGDPFEVKACKVLPPTFDASGRMNASRSHIQLNAQAIEYHLNVEWLPSGMYPVGVVHTHPGEFDRLSGEANGTVGDVPAMRTILRRAQGIGRKWKYFLAPIITLANEIKYTGWVVTLDRDEPMSVGIEWTIGSGKAVDEAALWKRIRRHSARMKNLTKITELSPHQRALAKRALGQTFEREVRALIDTS